jgi:hypothetical protein
MRSGERRERSRRGRIAAARMMVVAIALLAIGYVVAVGAWLWTLRDGISGPDLSTGLFCSAPLRCWRGWPGSPERDGVARHAP